MTSARLLVSALLILVAAPSRAEPPQGLVEAARTQRFVFYATPEAEGAAGALATQAEAVRDRIGAELGRDYPGITEVRVAQNGSAFRAIQPKDAQAPSWAAGVAYPAANLIVLNVRGGARRASPAQVLAHEISHLALMRIAPGRFPRWFLEGMATYHAGEWQMERAAILAGAVVRDGIIDLDDLTEGWPRDPADVPVAYAQSIALISWLFREHGEAVMQRLVEEVLAGREFLPALEEATSLPLWQLERDFRKDLRLRYTWLPAVTSTGFVWGIASLLFLAAYLRRRRERARKFETLDDPLPPEPEAHLADVILFPAAQAPPDSAHER